MIWVLLACQPQPKKLADSGEHPVVEETPWLTPAREIRRLSLDLRGTLPSLQEYHEAQTEQDIANLTQSFLDEPAFEEALVMLLSELWYTRVDSFDISANDFNLDMATWSYPFHRAVGEEPLRLMSYVASHDLPWTEIVTADYTMANELLGSIFPVDYPADGSGWLPVSYDDGRPAVGVLATNGLWWRYPTDSFNMNRTRAAMITKLLLCDDYLQRPVSFEASENALADTDQALKSDAACLTCHSSLDPLAASMFGFWWLERFNPLEASYYHPERELMGAEVMGVAPAWFGIPVNNFMEVGLHIAQDPRFHQCTARNMQELLLERKLTVEDYAQTVDIQRQYQAAGYQLKAMLSAIVKLPEYRLADATDEVPNARSPKMLSPYQLETTINQLTGYHWGSVSQSLMDDDYRAMAGGVDGSQTFSAQQYPSMTSILVLRRYVQSAVTYAVENQLNQETGLLSLVTAQTTPQDQVFQDQLKALRLQLHGRSADDEWLAVTTELWQQAYERGGSELAWIAVLSGMFQDIDFVSY